MYSSMVDGLGKKKKLSRKVIKLTPKGKLTPKLKNPVERENPATLWYFHSHLEKRAKRKREKGEEGEKGDREKAQIERERSSKILKDALPSSPLQPVLN